MKVMQEQNSSKPFQPLGRHLKYLREQIEESVAEVSGAVEIDIDVLERIEAGVERPSEDILMLLISHFDMHEHEALRLWELAGYEKEKGDNLLPLSGEMLAKPMMVLLAVDTRTMYTDGVEIENGKKGVTITFTQGKGRPVSRIGMSHEQAKEVMRELHIALLKSQYLGGPRQLPPSVDK